MPADPSLALDRGDFSLCVWVLCAPGAGDTGDILTQYDPEARRGLNLTVTASAPEASCGSTSTASSWPGPIHSKQTGSTCPAAVRC